MAAGPLTHTQSHHHESHVQCEELNPLLLLDLLLLSFTKETVSGDIVS